MSSNSLTKTGAMSEDKVTATGLKLTKEIVSFLMQLMYAKQHNEQTSLGAYC